MFFIILFIKCIIFITSVFNLTENWYKRLCEDTERKGFNYNA